MSPTLILVALAAVAVALLVSESVLHAVGLGRVKINTVTWLVVMVVLLLGSGWADDNTAWPPSHTHLVAVLIGAVVTGLWFNEQTAQPKARRVAEPAAQSEPAEPASTGA